MSIRRSIRRSLTATLLVAMLSTACGTATSTDSTATPSTAPTAETSASTGAQLPRTGIRPVEIEIPSIDVDASIIGLDIRGSAPEVPSSFGDVGWYEQTRKPGEIGPAVLAGHIDSQSGPAVFFRLDELETGDRVLVRGGGAFDRDIGHCQDNLVVYTTEVLP